MNLELSPEWAAFLKDASQRMVMSEARVVEYALQLLQEEELVARARTERLRKEIEKGVESLKQGKGIPAEEVFERLEKKLQAMKEAKEGMANEEVHSETA